MKVADRIIAFSHCVRLHFWLRNHQKDKSTDAESGAETETDSEPEIQEQAWYLWLFGYALSSVIGVPALLCIIEYFLGSIA